MNKQTILNEYESKYGKVIRHSFKSVNGVKALLCICGVNKTGFQVIFNIAPEDIQNPTKMVHVDTLEEARKVYWALTIVVPGISRIPSFGQRLGRLAEITVVAGAGYGLTKLPKIINEHHEDIIGVNRKIPIIKPIIKIGSFINRVFKLDRLSKSDNALPFKADRLSKGKIAKSAHKTVDKVGELTKILSDPNKVRQMNSIILSIAMVCLLLSAAMVGVTTVKFTNRIRAYLILKKYDLVNSNIVQSIPYNKVKK